MKRVMLHNLLGRKVMDRDGKKAGRIEEFLADTRGSDTFITHYLLGSSALFERLDVPGFALMLMGFAGARSGNVRHKVRWDQMDLADTEHPRLKCRLDEVECTDD